MKNDNETGDFADKYVTLLGVRVDSTSLPQVLRFFRSRLAKKDKFSVVTPNPEIVTLAQKDKKLLSALNSSDLSLPDGVGLIFASRFLGQGKLNRLPGREVFLELVRLGNKLGWRLFFLGGLSGEAKGAKEILERSFKSVKIESHPGPNLDENANPRSEVDRKVESEAVILVNNYRPDILFVAFGAPKQEKWIVKWLPKLEIGGAMVVGGAFRYISGNAALPPRWLGNIGLEWLWRLLAEPARIKRILIATIIFPFRVLFYKLSRI